MKWTKDFLSNYKITCLHRIVKLVITESAKCTDTCINVKYIYCSIYLICKILDENSTKITILSKLCMYLLKTNLIYKYLYNKIYFSDKPISNYRYQNYTLYYNTENTKHNKPFIYNSAK